MKSANDTLLRICPHHHALHDEVLIRLVMQTHCYMIIVVHTNNTSKTNTSERVNWKPRQKKNKRKKKEG
jgi:hypothetical protein